MKRNAPWQVGGQWHRRQGLGRLLLLALLLVLMAMVFIGYKFLSSETLYASPKEEQLAYFRNHSLDDTFSIFDAPVVDDSEGEVVCSRGLFTKAGDIYMNDSLPTSHIIPYVRTRRRPAYFVGDKIVTPKWSSYDINLIRAANGEETAKVRVFYNVSLFRHRETTYFCSPQIYGASERCILNEKAIPTIRESSIELAKLDIVEVAVLTASQEWGNAFFHNMIEESLSMGPVIRLFDQHPNLVLVHSNPAREKYLFEFYDLMGINKSRLHYPLPDHPIFVRTLYIPYMIGCGWSGGQIIKSTRDWVRSRLAVIYDEAKSRRTILVIDRKDSPQKTRIFANTRELIGALQRNFPQFTLERGLLSEMSLLEQIKAFARARIVIAPHGAGLINMLFMQDDGAVLEIYNKPDEFNGAFASFASKLELDYRMLAPLTVDGKLKFSLIDVPATVDAVHVLLNLDNERSDIN